MPLSRSASGVACHAASMLPKAPSNVRNLTAPIPPTRLNASQYAFSSPMPRPHPTARREYHVASDSVKPARVAPLRILGDGRPTASRFRAAASAIRLRRLGNRQRMLPGEVARRGSMARLPALLETQLEPSAFDSARDLAAKGSISPTAIREAAEPRLALGSSSFHVHRRPCSRVPCRASPELVEQPSTAPSPAPDIWPPHRQRHRFVHAAHGRRDPRRIGRTGPGAAGPADGRLHLDSRRRDGVHGFDPTTNTLAVTSTPRQTHGARRPPEAHSA